MAGSPVPNDATVERSLGFLLVDAVRELRRDFRSRATSLKLTPALARLLYYVHRDPGSRQADLAARLEVSPVTLGRMVDRLAARGCVRRVVDPEDRRVFRVYVDVAGEAVVGEMDRIRALSEARATHGFTAGERLQLLTLLARIHGNLAGGNA